MSTKRLPVDAVDWIKHIEEKDFITAVFHPENINELKRQKGIKPQYQSYGNFKG